MNGTMKKLFIFISALFFTHAVYAGGFSCRAQCAVIRPYSGALSLQGQVKLQADVTREEAFDALNDLCVKRLHKRGWYHGEAILLKINALKVATKNSNCFFDKTIVTHTPLPCTGDTDYLP
jgi:hypothetical protein